MRGLASARRRAEEFETALESRQLPADAASDTRAFFELVSTLRELQTPAPRPEFVSSLRTRLVTEAPSALREATSAGVARPATISFDRSRGRRRVLSVAATTCILAGTSVGVAAASQSALPGETLYPVKRGIEQLEIRTAGSATDRGAEYLEQADTRLTEVEDLALTKPDDPSTLPLMREALDDFSESADEGADTLLAAYGEEGSPAAIEELRTFASVSAARLDEMMQTLPSTLHQQLADAAASLSEFDTVARQLCPTCSDLAPLTLSAALTELPLLPPDVDPDVEVPVPTAPADPANTGQPATGQPTRQPATGQPTPGQPTTGQPTGGGVPATAPPTTGLSTGGGGPATADPTISSPTTAPGQGPVVTPPLPGPGTNPVPTNRPPVTQIPAPKPPPVPVPVPTIPRPENPSLPLPLPLPPVPTDDVDLPTVLPTVPGPLPPVPTVLGPLDPPSVPSVPGLP